LFTVFFHEGHSVPALELHTNRSGRWRVLFRAQIPFFTAAGLVAIITVFAVPDALTEPFITEGFLIVLVSTVACAAMPWERWPLHWMMIIPAADLVAVALIRTVLIPVIPSVGLLVVFPLLWLAYGFRYGGISVGIVGAALVAVFPQIWSGRVPNSALEWANIITLPVLAIGVAVAVNIAARQLQRTTQMVVEQKEQLTIALRQSQDEQIRSRAIFDTVHAGVAFYDANNELVMSNLQAEAIVSRVGFRINEPPYAGPEAREADRTTVIPFEDQIIPRALRGETITDHVEWLGEPGNQIAILASADQVHRPDGGLLGTVIVAQDVTDLADAVNVREEFLATVSHELRTPLSSILGYLELIDDDIDAKALGIDDYIAVIERNAGELLRRVSELLSISDRGLTLHLENTDIREIVGTSIAKMKPIADARSIALRTTGGPTIPARVDPHRIQQVFDNLIQNSVKYSPPGSIVEITVTEQHGLVELIVTDDGVGMTPEEARQATHEFYRAPSARYQAIQGVGIGLSIVQSIVRAHEGTLLIDSEPGRGTTIRITI
jgi:signal transduction histidine kinase